VRPTGKIYTHVITIIILIIPEKSTAGRNKVHVHAPWRELPVTYITRYLLF